MISKKEFQFKENRYNRSFLAEDAVVNNLKKPFENRFYGSVLV